jgi:hypothetical protein
MVVCGGDGEQAVGPIGFVDIWHNPTYYAMRQDPRLYSIFAQVLNEPHLTVSLDRVCLNAPTIVYDSEGSLCLASCTTCCAIAHSPRINRQARSSRNTPSEGNRSSTSTTT